MKPKVLSLSAAVALLGMFTGTGGGQGLQQLLTAPAESVAAISVYVCYGRCALGSKEISHAGISRPCLRIPLLGRPFPVVCEAQAT